MDRIHPDQLTPLDDMTPTEEERVVAYRSRGGQVLRCLSHAPSPHFARIGGFETVTAADLPDGGICTSPGCGRDVLATPTP